ncbi:Transferase [Corchorus olitorius]|uniref:Transferase n=1 Tax=Corchorus olitorius TaxID=93759 RepID=A0A1R3KL63_9ROSI|nr:Transferase [Corchorus olitorius]
MEKMKVEIMSRRTIKPTIPTPNHLRNFNLSLLDQDVPAIHYGSVVFFYPSDNTPFSQKSESLENSLSKILLHFYPLAGQVKDAVTIECNDQGACFIEAKTEFQLRDFLTQPDSALLNQLVPSTDPKSIRSTLACILLVQLTTFSCGGTAVSVSVSHKFADASSLCTFIQSWTAVSSREYGRVVVPNLVGASLLPPMEALITSTPPPTTRNCTTKRFVFHESQLANLKAKLAAAMGRSTTIKNVETVLAIILRSAAAASQSKNGSSSMKSALLNVVNLRKRMVPPLPKNTIGNLIYTYAVTFHEKDVELHQMVAKMKEVSSNIRDEKAKRITSKKGYKEVHESRKQIAQLLNGNTYTCANLCGYPLYEMDFGWGKPMWVTSPSNFKNLIVLTDSKLGGVDAWVTLDEVEMAIFERDQKLLEVASLNPTALLTYSRM